MSEHPPELVEKVARAMNGTSFQFDRDGGHWRVLARAALDAITETHAVVDKAVIARALAYGDSFRTPAAAGARAALRYAAGILPAATEADCERLQPRITAKPPARAAEADHA